MVARAHAPPPLLRELCLEEEALAKLDQVPWSLAICVARDDAESLRAIGEPAVALEEADWRERLPVGGAVLLIGQASRIAGDLRERGVPTSYGVWPPLPFVRVTDYLAAQTTTHAATRDDELLVLWRCVTDRAQRVSMPPTGHPGLQLRPRLRSWRSVCDDPPVEWVVEGALVRAGLTVLAGEPAAGKTLLALDIALRCAHGLDWMGRRCRAASTLYLAGEGSSGLGARLRAWRAAHPSARPASAHYVAVADGVPDLAGDGAPQAIEAQLQAAEQDFGRAPDTIVVDTLAMAAPSADENDAGAMGAVLRTLADLRARRGVAVLLVHHTRKPAQGAQRADQHAVRGSSAITGAADVVLLAVHDGDARALRAAKVRDGEAPPPLRFRVVAQDTGLARDDGRAELGPVILPAGDAPAADPPSHLGAILVAVDRLGGTPTTRDSLATAAGLRLVDGRAAIDLAIGSGELRALPDPVHRSRKVIYSRPDVSPSAPPSRPPSPLRGGDGRTAGLGHRPGRRRTAADGGTAAGGAA